MGATVPFKPLYERYNVTEDGCWLWSSTISGRGYPSFQVAGKTIMAHKYFYEFYRSVRIPSDMQVDHLCLRKTCVNPLHLEVVTQRENILRSRWTTSAINARKTECPQGHPLSGDNLRIGPDGRRKCRTCHRVREKARYDKQYAAYYTRYLAIVDEGR